MRTIINI